MLKQGTFLDFPTLAVSALIFRTKSKLVRKQCWEKIDKPVKCENEVTKTKTYQSMLVCAIHVWKYLYLKNTKQWFLNYDLYIKIWCE